MSTPDTPHAPHPNPQPSAPPGEVCDITGGQCHVYMSYNARADGQKFATELSRAIAWPFGYEAIMRVRASEGLRPTGYYGSFVLRNGTDMEMAGIGSNRSVAVRLHYDGTIPEGTQHAYVQVALLYTSAYVSSLSPVQVGRHPSQLPFRAGLASA